MAAYVVVQFAERNTRSARRSQPRLTSGRLKRVIAEHGGVLLPASEPGTRGGEASSVATITVPDMAHANQLSAALREIDGIETAYAKPGEELP